MAKTYDHLSEFLIAKDDGRSTIKVFTATPTPLEEKNLGVLFAVLEIDSPDEINDEILELIIEEIDSHYYQSETFEVESAFESALQKTNHRVQELVGEIGEEWLRDLNVVIGVQKDNKLVFTNIGRVIALMIHGTKVMDILDTARAKAEDINPVKVFSNTVAGELDGDSLIFFATETILDYLSREKIKRVITENDDDTAIQEFTNLLLEDTTNTNFGALILRKQTKKASAQTEGAEPDIPVINKPEQGQSANGLGPQGGVRDDSMSELLGRQSRTEELLTSSIWPSLKKNIRDSAENLFGNKKKSQEENDDFFAAAPEQDNVPAETERHNMPLNNNANDTSSGAKQAGDIAMKILKGIGQGILVGADLLKRGVLALVDMVKKASGRGGRTTSSSRSVRSVSSLNTSASRGITGAIQWFGKLTVIQKTFFVLAIVLLLVFAQSVINRDSGSDITVAQEEGYEQQMQDIEAKINEGKAAVLYDEEQARTLLIEARDMLAAIPQESEVYVARGEELSSSIENQLKRVNNVITLDNPSPVIDYTSVNPEVQISKLVLLGASMYGFDANNTSVYRGNLETRDVSVSISEAGSGETFDAAAKASPGTGIVKLSNQQFALFNPVSESLSNVDLQYPEGQNAIVDVNVFGSRLYTLDPQTNDIYRHLSEEGDFAAGTGWLNDTSVQLDNAVSFSIDGDIYVLKNTGRVIRLSAGVKDEGFALSDIDPAVENATVIYTDENSDNLYLLDPSQNRVVVFDKTGSLVVQYQSESFGDMKDMVVDEANGSMYVLSGTQVFEIELQDAPSNEEAPAEETTDEETTE